MCGELLQLVLVNLVGKCPQTYRFTNPQSMASNLGSGRFFREHIVIRDQDTKYWYV